MSVLAVPVPAEDAAAVVAVARGPVCDDSIPFMPSSDNPSVPVCTSHPLLVNLTTPKADALGKSTLPAAYDLNTPWSPPFLLPSYSFHNTDHPVTETTSEYEAPALFCNSSHCPIGMNFPGLLTRSNPFLAHR